MYTSRILKGFLGTKPSSPSGAWVRGYGSKLLTFVVYVSILASFPGLSCIQFLTACSMQKLEACIRPGNNIPGDVKILSPTVIGKTHYIVQQFHQNKQVVLRNSYCA